MLLLPVAHDTFTRYGSGIAYVDLSTLIIVNSSLGIETSSVCTAVVYAIWLSR